jgi:hypothetical protein
LMVFILIIFYGHKHIRPLFNKGIQSIALFISTLVVTAFTVYTYMFLPKIDFLPYKEGNDILPLMQIPEGAPRDSFQMVFIYEKDGKQVELGVEDVGKIDDTYTFIDRKDKLIRKGYEPPIHDFSLYNAEGINYTDSLLLAPGYKLVLTQTTLEKTRHIEKSLAQLAVQWQASGRSLWGLTSTPLDEVEAYRHEYQLPITYYTMDATPIKSMVRSNPGLMLMRGSVVVKKWSSYNFPTYEIVMKYVK